MEKDKLWEEAEQEGKYGLIPINYIQMPDHVWYHGHITKTKAEETLSKQLHDGTFLIRKSVGMPCAFIFPIKFAGGVQHFNMLRDGAGKYPVVGDEVQLP